MTRREQGLRRYKKRCKLRLSYRACPTEKDKEICKVRIRKSIFCTTDMFELRLSYRACPTEKDKERCKVQDQEKYLLHNRYVRAPFILSCMSNREGQGEMIRKSIFCTTDMFELRLSYRACPTEKDKEICKVRIRKSIFCTTDMFELRLSYRACPTEKDKERCKVQDQEKYLLHNRYVRAPFILSCMSNREGQGEMIRKSIFCTTDMFELRLSYRACPTEKDKERCKVRIRKSIFCTTDMFELRLSYRACPTEKDKEICKVRIRKSIFCTTDMFELRLSYRACPTEKDKERCKVQDQEKYLLHNRYVRAPFILSCMSNREGQGEMIRKSIFCTTDMFELRLSYRACPTEKDKEICKVRIRKSIFCTTDMFELRLSYRACPTEKDKERCKVQDQEKYLLYNRYVRAPFILSCMSNREGQGEM
ncbi:hypothetical protein J6590_099435 [Homalodisca vitripennis]|nr:hypothetical protein J6590_099435 [Homalodisca vitripennis]